MSVFPIELLVSPRALGDSLRPPKMARFTTCCVVLMYDTRPGWVCWAREKLNELPMPSDAEQIGVPPVPIEELPPLPQEAHPVGGRSAPLLGAQHPAFSAAQNKWVRFPRFHFDLLAATGTFGRT